MLLKKSFWLTVVLAASAHAAERPRIEFHLAQPWHLAP